jgi:predicted deacetylase
MNWGVWAEVEAVLVQHGVRPIVAVVPDNRDPKLDVAPEEIDFWGRVREWQARGWAIAMHGYQHQYVTRERGLVGLRTRSEFAGLPFEEQSVKVSAAADVFEREGVRVDAWVAPAHSFDESTVDCLAAHGVPVISDGLHCWPYRCSRGLIWVPQQLWGFRWRPFGVWTVCQHVNSWTERDVAAFAESIATYRTHIADLGRVTQRFASRERQAWDQWGSALLRGYMRAGSRIRRREI